MSKQISLLGMIAACLMGFGFFSVFYPLCIKLMAPARAWESYQSYLLVGGIILLSVSFILFRMDKSRRDRQ